MEVKIVLVKVREVLVEADCTLGTADDTRQSLKWTLLNSSRIA